MIAEGRLSSSPKSRPTAHPGHGRATHPMTSPMAKRSVNAPSNAVHLSGKGMASSGRPKGRRTPHRRSHPEEDSTSRIPPENDLTAELISIREPPVELCINIFRRRQLDLLMKPPRRQPL